MPSGEAICLVQEEDKTGFARPMNYQLLHDRILSRAKARVKSFGEYYETHHIIPRSMGGTDEEANLVALTAREHFIMHYLLTKMTTGEDKKSMIYAFNMMKTDPNGQGKRYINSRLYEANRKRLSEILGIKCIIDGIEFASIVEAANHYGVSRGTIEVWIEEGGKSRPLKVKKKACIIDGIEFSSIREAASHYGVSKDTIKRWIKEGGKSRPVTSINDKESCIIDGVEFSSLTAAGRHYGVTKQTIKVWLKEGGKSRPSNEGGGKPCIIDGIEFKSVSEAARHYEVATATIRQWIKEGGKSRPLQRGIKIA